MIATVTPDEAMHKPHIPYITLCYFAQLIYKVRNGLCSAGKGMQFFHLSSVGNGTHEGNNQPAPKTGYSAALELSTPNNMWVTVGKASCDDNVQTPEEVENAC